MSGVQLLPPEIEGHPDLDFLCPHCSAELTVPMASVWRQASKESGVLGTSDHRARAIRYVRLRVACPACDNLMDIAPQEHVTITWTMSATLPDATARVFPDGALFGGRPAEPQTPTIPLTLPEERA